jgi:hypothetical protein
MDLLPPANHAANPQPLTHFIFVIGSTLSKPERDHGGARFAARCYKGGSPETPGTATIRRLAPDTIALALHGFVWTTEKPDTFHRCAAR